MCALPVFYTESMDILAHTGRKIKDWSGGGQAPSEWLLAGSIVVIALISFGLGRLSVSEGRPVVPLAPAVEEVGKEGLTITEGTPPGGEVVVSRSGTAYHYPWCPGASQIAERNKVWFESAEAARAAGYAPAKNCKGLE